MVRFILSDRGDNFTLACVCAAGGITIALFVIPGVILSMIAANIVYFGVLPLFGEIVGTLIALCVYYTGVMAVCVLVTAVYNWLFESVVVPVADLICTAVESVYLSASYYFGYYFGGY